MFLTSRRFALALGAALAVSGGAARAQQATPQGLGFARDFAFTQSWLAPRAGQQMVEVANTYNNRDQALDGTLKFETGVGRHLSLAPSVLYGKDKGEAGQVVGYRMESRYKFGEFHEGKFLPAGYLQYEKEKDDSGELVAQAVLSRYVGRQVVSLNFGFQRPFEGGAVFEPRYELGFANPIPNTKLRYGFEAGGNLHQHHHGAGPLISYDLNETSRAVLSANFGLSNESENRFGFIGDFRF